MISLRDWTLGNRAALAILAAATIGAGVELVRAQRPAPLPARAFDARVELPLLAAPPEEGTTSLAQAVDAVANVDPFRPDRSRPATRFRVADGDRSAMDSASTSAPAPVTAPPTLVLRGIARLANGNALAVLSLNGGATQIVRVGETLDQYRLTRVDSNTATISGRDTTILLRLPNTSSGTRP